MIVWSWGTENLLKARKMYILNNRGYFWHILNDRAYFLANAAIDKNARKGFGICSNLRETH